MKTLLLIIVCLLFADCNPNYSIEKYSDYYLVKKSKPLSRDEYLWYNQRTKFGMWGNYIVFNSKEWGTKFKAYEDADSALFYTLKAEEKSDLLQSSEPTEIIKK